MTGVCTTVLGNIEMCVHIVLVNIMSRLIGTLVFAVMIIIFEWRVGLIAAVAMMTISVISWVNGAMPLANALMCIVMSFLVFGQVKLFGMGMSMLRLASASIDRVLQTEDMEQMDENCMEFSPKTHMIEFQNVKFS